MDTFVQVLLATVLLIYVVWFYGNRKRDDSDGFEKRSGVIVYTDHKTGVQYIGTILGGITPRLNPDGSIHTVNTQGDGS